MNSSGYHSQAHQQWGPSFGGASAPTHLQPSSQMHSWQWHPRSISTPPYLGVPEQPVITPQQQQVASQSSSYDQSSQMQYQQHHLQPVNAQLYLGVEQQLQPVITPQQQQLTPQLSTSTTFTCTCITNQLHPITSRRTFPPEFALGDGIESVSGPSHMFPSPPPLLPLSALPLPQCDDQPEDQQLQQGKYLMWLDISSWSFFVIHNNVGSSSGTESDASSDCPPPSKRHHQGTRRLVQCVVVECILTCPLFCRLFQAPPNSTITC